MELMKIDGSFGEGGGQIIRTAVTLSTITKKPIEIVNIRKNRKTPGLRPQHLTGIKILGKICNAKIKGLQVGSTSIEFIPGEVESKKIHEDVGTAGSISLISQVLIPVVSFCKKKLELSITGGTDVSWSPTGDYTKHVLREAYSRMGIDFSMEIKKRGYYPKGGGLVNLEINPSKKINPINLDKRESKECSLHCSFSKINREVIESNLEKIITRLEERDFRIKKFVVNEDSVNEGAVVLLSSIDSKSIIGADSLLNGTNQEFSSKLTNNFTSLKLSVDDNLSDMLVVPASLSNDMSIYKVHTITSHLETNLYVTSKITGCKNGIGKIDDGYEVRIIGNSNSSV